MKLCIWWWLKQSMLTDAFGPRLESFKYVTVGDSNWIPFFKRWALSNSFVLESSIILTNSRYWNSFSFWSLYYSSLCLDVEKVNPSGVVCMCWQTEYRLGGLHSLYLVVAGSKLVFIEILKKSSQLLEENFSSPPIKFQVAFKFDHCALVLGNDLAFLTNEGVIYLFLLQKFSEAWSIMYILKEYYIIMQALGHF